MYTLFYFFSEKNKLYFFKKILNFVLLKYNLNFINNINISKKKSSLIILFCPKKNNQFSINFGKYIFLKEFNCFSTKINLSIFKILFKNYIKKNVLLKLKSFYNNFIILNFAFFKNNLNNHFFENKFKNYYNTFNFNLDLEFSESDFNLKKNLFQKKKLDYNSNFNILTQILNYKIINENIINFLLKKKKIYNIFINKLVFFKKISLYFFFFQLIFFKQIYNLYICLLLYKIYLANIA